MFLEKFLGIKNLNMTVAKLIFLRSLYNDVANHFAIIQRAFTQTKRYVYTSRLNVIAAVV